MDDHERFMRLLLTHEPEILRSVLVFVPHRPDARDIMQETAAALWSHFDEYDPSRPFVNWAHGFARNEVRRFLRARRRRQALTERAAAALMATADATEGTRVERERQLTDCLQRLPAEQRRLLDGYTLEYAVPWSLLGAAETPPRPGDTLAVSWTTHWSDAGGRLWRGQLVELRNSAEPVRIHTWERAATWGRALYR